jgi:hypothetical protein
MGQTEVTAVLAAVLRHPADLVEELVAAGLLDKEAMEVAR